MKFDKPAGQNPIDKLKVVGKPTDRVEGPLKTTGTAPYAYERHDVGANQAYGYILGSAISKGKIKSMNLSRAKAAPGVLAVVTHENAGKLGHPGNNKGGAALLGGPAIDHYHQAIALVIAETFEQARAAARLIRVEYTPSKGQYDLKAAIKNAPGRGEKVPKDKENPPVAKVGDFDKAFAAAEFKLDENYTTSDESHAMMEPHATIAAWEGDKLTVWTSNQMIAWAVSDLSDTLKISKDKIRVVSSYIGGGFGGKLWIRSDAVLAAIGARIAKRPVKVTLDRALIMNNTSHRPATSQRIRLGAGKDGKLTAIAHESWSGNLPGGKPETATAQTRLLYAAENRYIGLRKADLNLPEGNAMRAPGEAPGMMALEVAMDEMAEKLNLDPIQFRILNDTQVDPEKPERKFSSRHLIECMKQGAEKFAWNKRNAKPAQVKEGNLLIGMGMAAAFRNNMLTKSAARVKLNSQGIVTVETDMTDIGTGSYTIIAQTAAEMMGVGLDKVVVKLGDSSFPASAGSGGQWGGNNSTAGVFAACTKLREAIAKELNLKGEVEFVDGMVRSEGNSVPLAEAAKTKELVAEDHIEYDKAISKEQQQSTFGAHFVEVAVDSYTGEIRLRRMLAVCSAGRILNPKAARSQVIGAMVMGAGAALMEHLAVDKTQGYFVNHDLAGYEVPVHADIPTQEVVFLDVVEPRSSPMKAMGIAELGICGVGAAIANAIYNATGVRVRDYPITLDKLIDRLPQIS